MNHDSRPIDLASSVEYQADAVVSKTLQTSEAGTVTLFAFAKGQELSEHTAPFEALVQVLEGTVEITIAGESHTVGRGQVIVMPADRPHALRAIEPFKMLLTMIKPNV